MRASSEISRNFSKVSDFFATELMGDPAEQLVIVAENRKLKIPSGSLRICQ